MVGDPRDVESNIDVHFIPQKRFKPLKIQLSLELKQLDPLKV